MIIAQETRNVDYESMVEKNKSGIKKVKSLIFQFGIMPVNTVVQWGE